MLITKLYWGFAMVLLGCFPFEDVVTSKKNTPLVAKINKFKNAEQNIQQPGKEIYTDFCIRCHGGNGKGDGINIPPLAGSDWLTKKRKQSIHAVKFGQNGEIVVNKKKFNNNMPPMGLSNQEVADVMNYIMTSWGNKQKKKVTEKEVAEVLN
ncbi:cytochrome c [Flavobacterium alvei]|uniref:c-type cytochrome n=1 Tax=Flavobacterium alvei TaxID=2080416 RepID=UPI0026EBABE3|nr:cytochrome c [Flavobacterium alvei]